jgi:hypothetical protein
VKENKPEQDREHDAKSATVVSPADASEEIPDRFQAGETENNPNEREPNVLSSLTVCQ